jgi:hypothetical protein
VADRVRLGAPALLLVRAGIGQGVVTDSNIFKPGSTWEIRATPANGRRPGRGNRSSPPPRLQRQTARPRVPPRARQADRSRPLAPLPLQGRGARARLSIAAGLRVSRGVRPRSCFGSRSTEQSDVSRRRSGRPPPPPTVPAHVHVLPRRGTSVAFLCAARPPTARRTFPVCPRRALRRRPRAVLRARSLPPPSATRATPAMAWTAARTYSLGHDVHAPAVLGPVPDLGPRSKRRS